MSAITLGVVSAPFDRDLEGDFARAAALIEEARGRGVQLLALPEATLGGYLSDLRGSAPPPPAFRRNGPEIARLAALAGDMVVCAGYCEQAEDGKLYNSVVCVDGSGVLGHHRKVHQPLREDAHYAAGETFAAFDTPVGRVGMMICYDKAFPESARSLALDGAQIVVCVSAWPGSRTNAPERLEDDRWKHRFDIFDQARALENQVVWLSANQSGSFGSLRFVASAKVVGPGGDVLAGTGVAEGLAVVAVDVEEALTQARRAMGHLRDRRPAAYATHEPVAVGS
ncbi:carbon-nitrogen hydrolase family protein [Kineosporia sp. J2-2]|uniref:Carbon-nitrogen hydrolase family protein n=1 Tax=Kineosporia corallincola TaxID=2835133 RepID=A0ABS5T951_9ACTN|nr:carbon-nitrogen hydrolase family protein [Kineosporia corallincola]MBT0767598.1 carbon-nitrogen hydrolase family protein [Kineosporia corallincola]